MEDKDLFIGSCIAKPLSKEETLKLFKSSKYNIESRNKIIEHNIGLVIREINNKFYYLDYEKKELVSIGIIGLIKAVDTFDLSKNIEFSTYAVTCIDNEFFTFIKDNKNIKADISFEEVIGVDKNSDDNIKLEELLADETDFKDEIEKKELFDYLRELINKLNERDKKIIMLYFGFTGKCYTTTEIGKTMNLSQPQISRIISKIVNNFAINLEKNGLIELHIKAKSIGSENCKPRKIKKIYELFSDYTEAEIDFIISGLNEDEKELLKFRYGEDLHNPRSVPLSKENQIKFYHNLVQKIKGRLEKAKNIGNENQKVEKIKTIYELLNDYTEEEIDFIILGLNDKDKELLKLKYGEDLHHPHNVPLSKEDQIKFHSNLVRKMKRRLEKTKNIGSENCKSRKIKTIYEIFSEYTEEEIDSIISELNDEDKELLKLKYGEDLHHPHNVPLSKEDQIKFYNDLVQKMKRRLKKTNMKKIKTIYELFSEYTEEEIDRTISELTDEDKELLKLKYGEDLHHPHNMPLSREYLIKFHSNLVPKIKRRLENPNMKKIKTTIYELFSEYTEEEIDSIISELNDEDKELLKLKYGEDLHHPHNVPLSQEDQIKFYKNIVQKMKRRLKNVNVKKIKTIYEIFSEYTEEEIDFIISGLNDDERELLKLRYGEDLHHPHGKHLSRENQIKFYHNLVQKMKRRLENPNMKKPKTTIYELFSEYTEEEIDSIISKLNDEEKNLLKLKYGEDLHHPHNVPLSQEDKVKFHNNLVQKMKRRLKNPKAKKIKTIYEIFSDYTECEINRIISELNDEDKELLKLKYGENLHHPHNVRLSQEDQIKFYNNLVPKMKRRLENPKVKKIKTIYEIFNDYTEEEIDFIILGLNDEDKQLLKLRYGEDLHNLYGKHLSKENQIKFHSNLVPKIKRRLENLNVRKIKTIYEIFNDYTEDEINCIISELNDEDKELLKLKYGEDLHHPYGKHLSREDQIKFHSNLVQKMKRRLEKAAEKKLRNENPKMKINNASKEDNNKLNEQPENITKEDYIKLLNLLKTPSFFNIVSTLTIKEAIIISLKLGYVDGKCFRNEQIAKFLEISEEEVVSSIKKFILHYKEYMNQFQDNLTNEPTIQSGSTRVLSINSKGD